MRDLKECQAAVFRRSEIRIKERKKRRNRILMTCIPMVLGITVITAVLWSKTPTGPNSKETEAEAWCVGNSPRVWQEILVSGQGKHLTYKNEETLQIVGFLDACTAEKPIKAPENSPLDPESGKDCQMIPENAPEAPGDDKAPSAGGGETTETENKHSVSQGVLDDYLVHADEGFTITINERQQYCLSGNLLADRTNNKTYVLTPEQADRLRELLGVSGS